MGETIIKLFKAISSNTRYSIFVLIDNGELEYFISNIAKKINQTEANISAQIKILEKANLITCTYTPGTRGVKKTVKISEIGKLLKEFIKKIEKKGIK